MKRCPSCSDERGTSIRLVDLTTDPRLILHCDNCQHEWPFPASSRERPHGAHPTTHTPRAH